MGAKKHIDIVFSEEITDILDKSLVGYCLHFICTSGECSFRYGERISHMSVNDVAIMTRSEMISELWTTPSLKIELLAAPNAFLQGLLPPNNFGIQGEVSLFGDPIIHLTEKEASIFLTDIRALRDRIPDFEWHSFYDEMMGGLCLTMMNDLFEFHSHRDTPQSLSERSAWLVRQFTRMLQAGKCKTERGVAYYAESLSVTPKYLSNVVRRLTGRSASYLIDRYAMPMVLSYLKDPEISLQQIADIMEFSSLSHFSRYCSKRLGVSPSEYRSKNKGKPRKSKPDGD